MKRNEVKVLLGTTDDEFVFANVCFSKDTFSVSFDVLYPVVLSEKNLKYRLECTLDCMDKSWKYDKCEEYDCTPSKLIDTLIDELELEDIIPDIDTNYSFSIKDMEDEVALELVGCGQGDYRDSLNPINEDFSKLVFSLWDKYHLRDLPLNIRNNFEEQLKNYVDSFDEMEFIKGHLNYLKGINKLI